MPRMRPILPSFPEYGQRLFLGFFPGDLERTDKDPARSREAEDFCQRLRHGLGSAMLSKKGFQLLKRCREAQLCGLLPGGGCNRPHPSPGARADSPKGEPEA